LPSTQSHSIVSESLFVDKIEKRNPQIPSVSRNINQYKGLSYFSGLLLIVSSIMLFGFTLLFSSRASKLAKTNNDLSIQLQRIKTKFKEKKGGVKEKRKHFRFACLVEADFVAQDRAYKGFIRNVSSGGAYIETRESFTAGQKTVVTFPSPNREGHIKMAGAIVRTDANGIAILFENNI